MNLCEYLSYLCTSFSVSNFASTSFFLHYFVEFDAYRLYAPFVSLFVPYCTLDSAISLVWDISLQ